MMKNKIIITIIITIVISCNVDNRCITYLAENEDSMDVVAIPVSMKGKECGFFIGYNTQIHQTLYLEKYPDKKIDYKSFLIKLYKKDIHLDDFLLNYDIEIINYDSILIKEFVFDDYLIKRDKYYYFKNNLPLLQQYNVIKILFDNSYQVMFNDYSGEYYFKKCK